jgi:hypothetical protein
MQPYTACVLRNSHGEPAMSRKGDVAPQGSPACSAAAVKAASSPDTQGSGLASVTAPGAGAASSGVLGEAACSAAPDPSAATTHSAAGTKHCSAAGPAAATEGDVMAVVGVVSRLGPQEEPGGSGGRPREACGARVGDCPTDSCREGGEPLANAAAAAGGDCSGLRTVQCRRVVASLAISSCTIKAGSSRCTLKLATWQVRLGIAALAAELKSDQSLQLYTSNRWHSTPVTHLTCMHFSPWGTSPRRAVPHCECRQQAPRPLPTWQSSSQCRRDCCSTRDTMVDSRLGPMPCSVSLHKRVSQSTLLLDPSL